VNQSEFLKMATADADTPGKSVAQAWLMLWISGALFGSILIGQAIAFHEWPWSGMVAAQKWVTAPLSIFIMLKAEEEFGGKASCLFRKLIGPVLLAVFGGWVAYSGYGKDWVALLFG